jgi:hypothetical protein
MLHRSMVPLGQGEFFISPVNEKLVILMSLIGVGLFAPGLFTDQTVSRSDQGIPPLRSARNADFWVVKLTAETHAGFVFEAHSEPIPKPAILLSAKENKRYLGPKFCSRLDCCWGYLRSGSSSLYFPILS